MLRSWLHLGHSLTCPEGGRDLREAGDGPGCHPHLPEKPRLDRALGVQGEEAESPALLPAHFGSLWVTERLLPAHLPASARLLLSWLSAYLNLLMKTCFTVQSADGSSSLPKESRLTNRKASRLPGMGGWGLREDCRVSQACLGRDVLPGRGGLRSTPGAEGPAGNSWAPA